MPMQGRTHAQEYLDYNAIKELREFEFYEIEKSNGRIQFNIYGVNNDRRIYQIDTFIKVYEGYKNFYLKAINSSKKDYIAKKDNKIKLISSTGTNP